jgi:hypothetical protein
MKGREGRVDTKKGGERRRRKEARKELKERNGRKEGWR